MWTGMMDTPQNPPKCKPMHWRIQRGANRVMAPSGPSMGLATPNRQRILHPWLMDYGQFIIHIMLTYM